MVKVHKNDDRRRLANDRTSSIFVLIFARLYIGRESFSDNSGDFGNAKKTKYQSCINIFHCRYVNRLVV